jgi:hypothetical protein
VNVSGAKRQQIIAINPAHVDHTTFELVAAEVFTLLKGQHFKAALQSKAIRLYLEQKEMRNPAWLEGGPTVRATEIRMGMITA